MKQKLLRSLLLLLAVSMSTSLVWGQGTTTAKVNGRVIDDAGEGLPGAQVMAIHTPTGSRFGAVTGTDGFYQIANMNVGGPYTVTISFVGFENVVRDNIHLSLGQTFEVNGVLSETATELSELVITATADVFDGNRTGPETVVDERAINDLPTVERSLSDFARLTPQAAVRADRAVSFSGVNNRFNAIFIDGAVNNDVFGLANSGTNGGQAGISPISIDALEQIQVVVAPYDVTLGGFAGGGINAVTRSGTNEFQGSAYYFVRNEKLSGKTPTDDDNQDRIKLDPFTARTYGARLGGPLIKNKLFFFANVEFLREEEPKPFTFAGYEGDSDEGDLNDLINYVNTAFGYDPGGYTNNIGTRDSDKVLAKIDWNINDNHKLSMRHSYVLGQELDAPRPNSRRIVFFNTGVDFPSKTNSTAIELKSNFGNNASNNLILGLTTVRDDRDIIGDPFPQLEITDGDALIEIGTDNFSYSNIVNQDVFTLTNNFNLYKGKHTWTFGTHWEYFKIENLFTIFSTPLYFYDDLASFISGGPGFSLFGHEQLAPGQSEIRLGDEAKNLGPTFNAMQAGFYVQDEIQVDEKLKLSIGIRADIPIYLDDAPLENTDFNDNTIPLIENYYDLKGAQASKLPKTSVLWSPRIGFNYDVKGNKATQLRGGIGLFTSRIPWVWPGAVYIRNGLTSSFDASFGPFRATPQQWLERTNTTSPSGDVDLFAEDFKYPQIIRASIGADHKLPWDMIGSADFTYTKTVNNINVKSVNLKPSIGNLEGADNRPIFDEDDPIDPTYSAITWVDNTRKGFTWNATFKIEKPYDNGFAGSIAYSFTRADALFDGQGFINGTNWRQMHSINGRNNPMVGRSIFDVGSRVVAFLSYRKEYGEIAATSISLFYNGQSGQPFSYTYNDGGDLTGDGVDDERNLIYVPARMEEIVFADQATAAAQWSALDAYIEGDDYLKDRRGQYAERNKSRTPFESVVDLKLTQDFFITTSSGQRHTLQVSFDIFNFSNFLNKDWGRRYFVGNDNFELLTFEGFALDSGGNPTKVPTFSFNDPGDPWDIITSGINSGRWAAQFGLRYTF